MYRDDHPLALVGWFLIGAGSFMSWLHDHGMVVFGVSVALAGLACNAVNAWVGWKKYKLDEWKAKRGIIEAKP